MTIDNFLISAFTMIIMGCTLGVVLSMLKDWVSW